MELVDNDAAEQYRAWAERLLAHVESGQLSRGDAHPCSYLPGQVARSQAFRVNGLDGDTYHALMNRGFRRSGDMFYSMVCEDCRKCEPIRVPTATFVPSRSQVRAQRRNDDVTMRVQKPTMCEATWNLYQRYVRHQHPDTPLDETPDRLIEWLYKPVVETYEAIYKIEDRLVAVSILDVCRTSISSVYHFFDPAEHKRSLGVFSVLAEIAWAQQLGIPYYYLGYWVEGAPTMHYKANYRPHELLRDGSWRGV
jgi:leucyl-tRNA---protein transferase